MKTLSLTVAAALSLLVGCAAPTSGTARVRTDSPEPAGSTIIATGTVRHALIIGDDATIAARRDSVAVRTPAGVKRTGVGAEAPSAYIPSSGMIYANAQANADLIVSLTRDAHGTAADVATGGVVSSDTSIATADVTGSEVRVHLTGKRGNSYVTAFDAQKNATAKFMVLSAAPRAGTVVIDDASMEPTGLYAGSGANLVRATDFVATTNDAYLNEMVSAPLHSTYPNGALGFADGATAQRVATKIYSEAGNGAKALYFPGKDVLVTLSPGTSSSETYSGLYYVRISAMATQADFDTYLDYGGMLSSSPLHDPNQEESQEWSFAKPQTSLEATAPRTVGVVLADGRKVLASSPEFAAAEAQATRKLVAYPQVGESVGEALTCELSKSASIDWSSMYTTASTKLSANASWNGGKPNIEMSVHPQLRVGGQFTVHGDVEAKCEKTMFTVPVAEWGIPVFGNVAVSTPVKVEFSVKASGEITVMTPRLEIGSAKDTSKPGTLGFSYTVGGQLHGEHDLATKATYTTLSAVAGSSTGNATVKVDAGIGAALGLEANVKVWVFKASVRADLGEALFGLSDEATFTISATGTYAATNDFKLGVFPKFNPTIQIDTPIFKKSFNLFTVNMPALIFSDERSVSNDEKLLPKRDAYEVHDGPVKITYLLSSDTVEVLGQGDVTWAGIVNTVTPGGRMQASSLRIPVSGSVANVSGIDLVKLAKDCDQAELQLTGANWTAIIDLKNLVPAQR